MAQTIQLRRGSITDINNITLVYGEPAFTAEGKLYVGNGTTKVLINPDLGTAALIDVGTASGNVPVIGANGKLDESIIPSIAITDTFVVGSESEMLALTLAQIGDVAVRTDKGYSYILVASPASTLTNWVQLSTPSDAPVISVNGKTGAVTLTPSDIGAEPAIAVKKSAFNVDFENTAGNIKMNGTASAGTSTTAARSDHVHQTDTSRAPLNSPALTGTPTAPTAAAATNNTQIATTGFVNAFATAKGFLDASSTIDGGTF